jgi:plastocyanin domain-containing protein
MSKTASIIIASLIIIATGYFVFSGPNSKSVNSPVANNVENSTVKDGVQYVNITAKGGYLPRISNAKAGIPTKLVIKTNGTYDCSAALVIRSLNFRKMLSNTGEETIDAGTPKSGDTIQGICAMGMYSFAINFQ